MSGDLEIMSARAGGRSSRYESGICEQVLKLAADGCSKAEIAAKLGVGRKTLYAWAAAHPEFGEAMKRAKDLEYAWWLKTGREGQFIKGWNAASWALQMRNRFGKRFRDGATAARHSEEPKDGTNAAELRGEMERKLSRIADAGPKEDVPCQPDATGTCEPDV
jgi:hypothetical protein